MKKPKVIALPPSERGMEVIRRVIEERKSALLEHLLFSMWEQHSTTEVMDNHHGDKTCTYCDIIRACTTILELEHPRDAQETHVEQGPLYRKKDL